MSHSVYDASAGAWKEVQEDWVYDASAGTWKQAQESWVYDASAGTWKQYHNAIPASSLFVSTTDTIYHFDLDDSSLFVQHTWTDGSVLNAIAHDGDETLYGCFGSLSTNDVVVIDQITGERTSTGVDVSGTLGSSHEPVSITVGEDGYLYVGTSGGTVVKIIPDSDSGMSILTHDNKTSDPITFIEWTRQKYLLVLFDGGESATNTINLLNPDLTDALLEESGLGFQPERLTVHPWEYFFYQREQSSSTDVEFHRADGALSGSYNITVSSGWQSVTASSYGWLIAIDDTNDLVSYNPEDFADDYLDDVPNGGLCRWGVNDKLYAGKDPIRIGTFDPSLNNFTFTTLSTGISGTMTDMTTNVTTSQALRYNERRGDAFFVMAERLEKRRQSDLSFIAEVPATIGYLQEIMMGGNGLIYAFDYDMLTTFDPRDDLTQINSNDLGLSNGGGAWLGNNSLYGDKGRCAMIEYDSGSGSSYLQFLTITATTTESLSAYSFNGTPIDITAYGYSAIIVCGKDSNNDGSLWNFEEDGSLSQQYSYPTQAGSVEFQRVVFVPGVDGGVVTFDDAGKVYKVDGQFNISATYTDAYNNAKDLTVDAAENVYVANNGDAGSIVKLDPANSLSVLASTDVPDNNTVYSIMYGHSYNIFVATTDHIYKYDLSLTLLASVAVIGLHQSNRLLSDILETRDVQRGASL